MANPDDKIKALELKQAQIKAKIQMLKAREVAQERKNDTRRKILAGGIVMKLVREGQIPEQAFTAWLDQHLMAERDRALFGLAASAALSPAAASGGAVSDPEHPTQPR